MIKLTGPMSGFRFSNRTFSSVVTLDASGAQFTGSLVLTDVSNLNITGARFDLTAAPAYTKAMLIIRGRNVYADRTTVVGSGLQMGVAMDGTVNGQVGHGTFTNLAAGIAYTSVNTGLLVSNKFIGAASDGIDIADGHRVTASNNSCSGSVPGVGAHPDCIQLWSIAGKPLQSDITVSNNHATGSTQGFSTFGENGGGLRIQFLGNTADLSDPQGVACYNCVDSTIANNHVTTLDGSTYQTVINVVGGSGNTVFGNTVAAYGRAPARSFDELADASSDDAAALGAGFDTASAGGLVQTPAPPIFAAPTASVPEPASWALLIAGFGAIGIAGRRARSTGRDIASMA